MSQKSPSTQISPTHKGTNIFTRRTNALWEGLYPTKIYQRFRTLFYEEKKRHLTEVIKQLDQYSLQIKGEDQEEVAKFNLQNNGILQIVKLQDLTYQQIIDFDRIFDSQATNVFVFKNSLEQYIQKIMTGIKLGIICYGCAESGKSYTLFGELKDYGLLLQFLLELWLKIEEIENFQDAVDVNISFYQYKGDEFLDLLVTSESSLDVYEGLDGEVKMVGITKMKAKNLLDCLKATKVAIINSSNNDQAKETNKLKKNKKQKAHFFVSVEVDYYLNFPDKAKAVKSTFTFLEFATVQEMDLYRKNRLIFIYKIKQILILLILQQQQKKPLTSSQQTYKILTRTIQKSNMHLSINLNFLF